MTNILTFRPQLPLSREEMLAEMRGKERSLIELERQLADVAGVVWPEGSPNEAPQLYRALGDFTVDELIAGVKSLHELTDRMVGEVERLLDERDRLRAELRGERERGSEG